MSTETVNTVVTICLVIMLILCTIAVLVFFVAAIVGIGGLGKKPIVKEGGPQNAGARHSHRTPGRSLGKALAQTARQKGRKPAGVAGNTRVQVRTSPWPPNRGLLGNRG